MKPILYLVSLMLIFTSCSNIKIEKQKKITINKTDSTVIKHFFNSALTQWKSYEWLADITANISRRLSGSPEAQKAVEYGENLMKNLKFETISLVGYRSDSQRYFKYHHSALDTFEIVNKRELELELASLTSMIYLLDTYLN